MHASLGGTGPWHKYLLKPLEDFRVKLRLIDEIPETQEVAT